MTRNPKGSFVLSLDTELAWGTRNLDYRPFYEKKREVTHSLLDLLSKYKLSATWAVVGHLFLKSCQKINGQKHPEIVRPTYAWLNGDWFDLDPCTNVDQDPIWYGPDIVKLLQDCPVPQEIGCHTFSHVVVDDPGCSAACFESELLTCQKLAQAQGIELKSFVFPKNQVAHLPVLAKTHFTNYRGRDLTWYRKFPRRLRQLAHIFDNLFIMTGPVVRPQRNENLVNIPGSYFYPHRVGWGRFIPISFRVWKVKNGIRKAIRRGGVYHLWFHPFNLASDPEGLLHGLDEIFAFVKQECDAGRLQNRTMGEIAQLTT